MDVYKEAQISDPIWLGAIAGNRADQEASEQSYSAFLPNIGFTASSSSNFQDLNGRDALAGNRREKYNANSWNLNITQSVFSMTNYAVHRQAQASVRRSDTVLTVEAQNLILRVAQAYFDVLSAQSDLTAVSAEKKATARQLDQAQKRFEVGLIAITDVHEAQASYDLVEADEIVAENLVIIARQALNEITGKTYTKLNDLGEQLELKSPEPDDIEAWVERAMDNNLSLTAAKIAFEVAQENVKVRRAGHYPTLDLVASTGKSSTHLDPSRKTQDDTIGLQFSVPIYTGGRVTSETRQALAELDQTSQTLTQTRRATEKQTRDAYVAVRASISRIEALQQAVVSAQSAVDSTEAGFEVGTRTIVDVLQAQRALYEAKNNHQKARYNYLLFGLQLKQAEGSLSEDDLIAVNNLLK